MSNASTVVTDARRVRYNGGAGSLRRQYPRGHIMRYGAVFDGSDQRQALVDAIDDAMSAGTGVVTISMAPLPVAGGTGVLGIDGTIELPSGIKIVSDVPGAVALHELDSTAALFDLGAESNIELARLEMTQEAGGVYDVNGTAPLIICDGASNVLLDRVFMRDTGKQGVSATAATNWTLQKCRALRTGRAAWVFVNGVGVLVEGGYAYESGDDVIAFNGSSFGCQAIGNRIYHAGKLLEQGSGIKMHGEGCAAIGNYIYQPVNGGIYAKELNGGGQTPGRLVITGNVVDGMADIVGVATRAAIRVENCGKGIDIAHNTIDAATPTDVRLDAFRFEGANPGTINLGPNTVQRCSRYAEFKGTYGRVNIRGGDVEDASDRIVMIDTGSKSGYFRVSGLTAGSRSSFFVHVVGGSGGVNLLDVRDCGDDATPPAGDFINCGSAAVDKLVAYDNDTSATLIGGTAGVVTTRRREITTAVDVRAATVGFFGVVPVGQRPVIADPAGGATIDAQARTAINSILDQLQQLGLQAP